MHKPLFAYSWLDAFMLIPSAAQLALIAWGALNFANLSLLGLGFFVIAHVLLTVFHYSIVVHNFIHNPFFSSKLLNNVYSVIATIITMTPCSTLATEHLVHHRHVNDLKDPSTGGTKDATSTYRFGISNDHETLWRYSFFTPIREAASLGEAYRIAFRPPLSPLLLTEIAALALFWITIVYVSWTFSLFYLAVVYLSQAANSAQNYFEHYGATPGNTLTDSVSCYDPIYNFICFNNGFHQEHHYRPGYHWTDIPKIKKEMLPENQRHVVRWGHFANLPGFARAKVT